jgi:hypothetical protein
MLCAIVAVAQKLAGILHRMWIHGNDFDAEAETETGAVIHSRQLTTDNRLAVLLSAS